MRRGFGVMQNGWWWSAPLCPTALSLCRAHPRKWAVVCRRCAEKLHKLFSAEQVRQINLLTERAQLRAGGVAINWCEPGWKQGAAGVAGYRKVDEQSLTQPVSDTVRRPQEMPPDTPFGRVRGYASGGLVGAAAARGGDLGAALLDQLALTMRRPTLAYATSTTTPSRTIRVELAAGRQQVTAKVDGRDESRLLELLREARARSQ
jgi:hypothetical protein